MNKARLVKKDAWLEQEQKAATESAALKPQLIANVRKWVEEKCNAKLSNPKDNFAELFAPPRPDQVSEPITHKAA